MKYIDLFCGTGAFSKVLSEKGHECVLANDICPNSEKIYKSNFPDHPFSNQDITKLENVPYHDILCGGFPCQPFSIAGNLKGLEDHRADTFWAVLRILEEICPSYFVLENVKNLLNHDQGKTYKLIKSQLEGLGYHVNEVLVDTCVHGGIPHHRERLYMVGSWDSMIDLSISEEPCRPLSDFFEDTIDGKYYYDSRFACWETIKQSVTERDVVYQYRRTHVRKNMSGVCPTLTANMGGGGHNVPLILDDVGIRKLTPRECFNLQGFTDYDLTGISDSGLYKLAGNAVSIPIVRKVVECLSI